LILNSKQHANCRNIEITLDATQIKYRDDGNFDNKKEREGFGLLGIKERLAKIGATLQQQDSNFVIEFK
jgi:signal transduction histidine kinase